MVPSYKFNIYHKPQNSATYQAPKRYLGGPILCISHEKPMTRKPWSFCWHTRRLAQPRCAMRWKLCVFEKTWFTSKNVDLASWKYLKGALKPEKWWFYPHIVIFGDSSNPIVCFDQHELGVNTRERCTFTSADGQDVERLGLLYEQAGFVSSRS